MPGTVCTVLVCLFSRRTGALGTFFSNATTLMGTASVGARCGEVDYGF